MGTLWTYSESAWRSMSMPLMNSDEKNRGTSVSTMWTRRRRLPTGVTVTLTSAAASSKPLALAVSSATVSAFSSFGIHTTPASAAASAARCIRLAYVYQAP